MGWLKRLFVSRDYGPLGPEFEIGAAALVKYALATDTADTGLSVTLRGCHIRGVPWGDWEFTCRRLAPAELSTATPQGDQ